MTRRRKLAVAAGALAVVGGGVGLGVWGSRGFSTELCVDIEREQLQAGLAGRFPQQSCALALACVRMAEPEVHLSEGSSRIGLGAVTQVTFGRRRLDGHVTLSGLLRYEREHGDFFLDDLRVEELNLAGMPREVASFARGRAEWALRRAMEGHPIYSLRGDGLRERLARMAVHEVRVVDGRLRVSFLRFRLF